MKHSNCSLGGQMQFISTIMSDPQARFTYKCTFKWTLARADRLENDPCWHQVCSFTFFTCFMFILTDGFAKLSIEQRDENEMKQHFDNNLQPNVQLVQQQSQHESRQQYANNQQQLMPHNQQFN